MTWMCDCHLYATLLWLLAECHKATTPDSDGILKEYKEHPASVHIGSSKSVRNAFVHIVDGAYDSFSQELRGHSNRQQQEKGFCLM